MHLDFDIIETPMPLHAFLPLQALPSVLQLPLPLQALRPKHFTLWLASAAGEERVAVASRVAAAAAIAAPDIGLIFIRVFLRLGDQLYQRPRDAVERDAGDDFSIRIKLRSGAAERFKDILGFCIFHTIKVAVALHGQSCLQVDESLSLQTHLW